MESDEKACPFCAEVIKSAAIKCKHCGEMLNIESASPVDLVQESEPELEKSPPAAPPQSKEQPPPEVAVGCFVLIVGACSILTFPRFGFALFALSALLLLIPGYLLLPIGHPKDPVTGEPQARPAHAPEKRLVAWAFTILLAVFAVAGAKRDAGGIRTTPTQVSSAPSESSSDPRTKTVRGPSFMAATKDALSNATDEATAKAYMLRGELWILPAGTKIRITDPGILTTSVIVLDGPHVGKTGLVASEVTR